MKVFISHAPKDEFLAKRITNALMENDFDVWNADTEILPGDNWAEKLSAALEESDAMVALISPESMQSGWVRREIEFALGKESYNQRLIPVLLEPEKNFQEGSIPWILKHLKVIQIADPDQVDEGILQITQTLRENSLVFD